MVNKKSKRNLTLLLILILLQGCVPSWFQREPIIITKEILVPVIRNHPEIILPEPLVLPLSEISFESDISETARLYYLSVIKLKLRVLELRQLHKHEKRQNGK